MSMSSAMSEPGLLKKVLVPAAVAAVSLTTAFIGALVLGRAEGIDGVNRFVETLSGDSGNLLRGLAPLGFAYAAGMVSAVNPCGFVMLPAYLGLYLGVNDKDAAGVHPLIHIFRALKVSGSVTLGFVVLFGAAGTLMAVGARAAVVDILPYLGLVIGIALALTGSWMVGGGKAVQRVRSAGRIQNRRPRTGKRKGLLPVRSELRHRLAELHVAHISLRHRDELCGLRNRRVAGAVHPLRRGNGDGDPGADAWDGVLQGRYAGYAAQGAAVRAAHRLLAYGRGGVVHRVLLAHDWRSALGTHRASLRRNCSPDHHALFRPGELAIAAAQPLAVRYHCRCIVQCAVGQSCNLAGEFHQ